MPSKMVLKSARESAYRDDPLAELSRIMGLNEEARQQVEQDDFGIDLEQELMGDLSGTDDPVAANTSSPTDVAPAFEDALATEIDSAFDDMFSEADATASATASAEPESASSQAGLEPGDDPLFEKADFAAMDAALAQAGIAGQASVAPVAGEMDDESIFDDADFAALDAALADTGIAEHAAVAPTQAAATGRQTGSAVVADTDTSLEDELRGLLGEPAFADDADPSANAPELAAGQVEDDLSLDELPTFDEADGADLVAADQASAEDIAGDAPFAAEEGGPVFVADDEPARVADDDETVAADDWRAAAEPTFAGEMTSTFDATDFARHAGAEVAAEPVGPELAAADDDDNAPAAFEAEAVQSFDGAEEPVYANDPLAYADEPVAYSDQPVAFAAEPAAYDAEASVAYGEENAVTGSDGYAAVQDAGDEAGPMLGEVEEPLLDAADFGEFEDEFTAEEGAVDLEAPAEDDVEAFAAEPGEWLAAGPAEDAPLAGFDPTGDPEASETQREWQPSTQDGPQPVSYAAADVYVGPDEAASDGTYDNEVDLAAFEAELSEIAVSEIAVQEEFSGEAVAGRFDIERSAEFAEDEPAHEAEEAEEPRTRAAGADSDDPFAALAAMAAAPPILKAFGRTNPVAVNPVAQRPGAAQPAAQAEEPGVPEPTPQRESYFSIPRRLREAGEAMLRPVEAVRLATSAAPTAATPAAPVAASAGAATAAPQAFEPRRATQRPAPEAPEVETIDVAESQVAVADDLDIPDLPAFEPVPAGHGGYDDFETDFANSYDQLRQQPTEPAWSAAARPTEWKAPAEAALRDDDLEAALEADLARIDAVSANFGLPERDEEQIRRARDADLDDDYEAAAPRRAAAYADDAYAAGAGFAGDAELEQEEPQRRRGLLIAAIVAGVAIAGGVGAFALSFGGGSGEPALVRAEPGPVKVKPENPGGVVVPNQDGKVYERVAGEAPGVPEQEKLVTTVEEPIEPVVRQADAALAAAEDASVPVAGDSEPATAGEALPGVEPVRIKSEDRVVPEEPTAGESAGNRLIAVAPRKVRTMIVRPDGTLAPRPEPEPAPQAMQPTTAAEASGADQAAAAVQPAQQVPNAAEGAGNEISILPADAQNVTAPSADEANAGTPVDADNIVVPRPRPTRQAAAEAPAEPEPRAEPASTATEPAQTQVAAAPAPAENAAAEPVAAAPVAEDLWEVQIASQPSREGAQASYEAMARRYSSVLGGKPVNIVQAEIPNKGTFWRVRIPAASKSDANILCAKLKTAGGDCFISR